MSTALIIIDMQLGNFQGSHPVHEGDRLLERVRRLIDKARSARTPIIYVQNNGGDGDPDEYGTPGWEIHPSIKPQLGDPVVQKGSPDAFHETGLHRELRSRGSSSPVFRLSTVWIPPAVERIASAMRSYSSETPTAHGTQTVCQLARSSTTTMTCLGDGSRH